MNTFDFGWLNTNFQNIHTDYPTDLKTFQSKISNSTPEKLGEKVTIANDPEHIQL